MTAFIEALNRITDIIWTGLLHASWQAAIVGALLLALVFLGRRWPAPVRHGLLAIGLIKFMIPPFLFLPTGILSQYGPAIPEQPSSADVMARVESTAVGNGELTTGPTAAQPATSLNEDTSPGDLPALPKVTIANRNQNATIGESLAPASGLGVGMRPILPNGHTERPAQTAHLSGPSYLLLVWMSGTVLVATWLAVQCRRISRINGTGKLIEDAALLSEFQMLARQLGLKQVPQLYGTDAVTVPYSCGLFTKKVVIPDTLIDSLPGEQLRMVMAHELAHHRRHDLWINWIQTLAFVVWWFHPVYWMLSRSIQKVREDCCDDLLLARGISSGQVCCATLLSVAQYQVNASRPQIAVTMAAQHPLGKRMTRLMDDTQTRWGRLSLRGIAGLAVVALLVLPGLRFIASTSVEASDTDSNLQLLQGVVTDSESKPIGGAQVFVTMQQSIHQLPSEHVRILERGTTDQHGRFRFSIDKEQLNPSQGHGFTVWTYKEGYTCGLQSFRQGKQIPPMEMTLDRPAAQFTILGPDQTPVTNAEVRPANINMNQGGAYLPEEMQQLLGRKTDEAGQVTFPVVDRKNVLAIYVDTPEYGTQNFTFFNRRNPSSSPPETISLAPAGKLSGQLIADEPGAVANVNIVIYSQDLEAAQDAPYRRIGFETLQTDAEGRFEVPSMLAGQLRLRVYEKTEFAQVALPPKGAMVTASETTRVEIPFRKCVQVIGRVVEHKTNIPVAGVKIEVRQGERLSATETNENGVYTLNQLPGSISMRFLPPASYVRLPEFRPVTIPRGEAHSLPDLWVEEGYTLKGRTMGSDGKPVKDLRVSAAWRDERTESSSWSTNFRGIQETGTSDDEGDFEIARVPAQANVKLTVYNGSIQVAPPLTIQGEQTKTHDIQVRRLDLITLTGSVVSPQGDPVPGISFRIRNEFAGGPNVIGFGIIEKGVTDASGRVRSRKQFDRYGKYQIEVLVNDKVVSHSDWLKPAEAQTTKFKSIVFRGDVPAPTNQRNKARAQKVETEKLTGLIIDHDGHTVGGAKVLVWSMGKQLRTQTSAQGSFVVADIPTEGAFLFIEADGFRFHGQWAQPEKAPIPIALVRSSEPAEPMRTLSDPPLPNELEQKAWQQFQPIANDVLKRSQDNERPRTTNISEYRDLEVLELMAHMDPQRTVEYVATHKFESNWYPDFVRLRVVRELQHTNIDAALAVVETITKENQKALALREMARSLPDSQKERFRQILYNLPEETSQNQNALSRCESMMFLAATYLAVGEVKQAQDILLEAETLVPKLGGGGRALFVRGMLAHQIALTDGTDTTRLLGKSGREWENNRYLGNIAHALAAKNPAASERIVERMGGRGYHEWIARICYDMATVDDQRARRIAETLEDPVHRAYALGMIAAALTDRDQQAATKLIGEAYALLVDTVETDTRTSLSVNTPVATAVGMLPIVERIDPTLVREYFWRSLSLRKASTFGGTSMAFGPYGDGQRMRLADPVMAACLARYDLEIARRVLHPPGDESTDKGAQTYPYYYFYTAAILDPQGTLEIVAALPADSRTQKVARDQAWKELFASFMQRGIDRWNALMDRQMHLWTVGKTDI